MPLQCQPIAVSIFSLCLLGNFECILFSADLFQNQLFRKILSGIPPVSNSLDPDQAQHFVGPDLGPNCLQRLSADDPSKPIVKGFYIFYPIFISLGKSVTEV